MSGSGVVRMRVCSVCGGWSGWMLVCEGEWVGCGR